MIVEGAGQLHDPVRQPSRNMCRTETGVESLSLQRDTEEEKETEGDREKGERH